MGEFKAGAGYLGRGQRWVLGHGRWLGFGLLPALITLVLYAAALVGLAFFTGDLTDWATAWADGWATPWAAVVRVLFTVVLWAAVLSLALITFTAVTLLIGDPFYEKLSEQVELGEGNCPEGPDRSLAHELWLSLKDSLYVLSRALLWTVPLFFLGFVPVLGQTVVPVLGLCVSGFFLALELTSVGMQRRGIAVRDRLQLLRGRRALALGFGLPLALCFLVPFLAVVLMPGAVAGAALLVRDVTGEKGDGGAEPVGPAGGAGGYSPPAGEFGPPPPGPYGPPAGPPGSVRQA